MIHKSLLSRTARPSNRGGFTLVELLVVIGIIAILAGVALGPITNGIKKAQQSGGVQSARTLGLAEFQYSNDNSQMYPFGTDAGAVATTLVAGGYATDPGIYTIGGSSEVKYTGTTASTNFPKVNVSWNFAQTSATVGLSSNVPDQTPLVFSCGGGAALGTALNTAGIVTATITSINPFGTAGMAVCYKSNSAKFLIATPVTPFTVTVEDGSWPGGVTVVPALGNNG